MMLTIFFRWCVSSLDGAYTEAVNGMMEDDIAAGLAKFTGTPRWNSNA